MRRRSIMMKKKGGVPYQTYDYLEANGVVYINTGYVPTVSTIITTTVYVHENQFLIVGARNSGMTNRMALSYTKENLNTWKFRVDTNTSNVYTGSVSNGLYALTLSSGLFTYNNNHKSVGAYATAPTVPLYLFNWNNNGSIFDIDNSSSRMYATTFHDGETLKRQFIPCQLLKNTTQTWDGNTHYAGECGMWDSVTDLFYGNANSSGSFTVGND